MTGNNRRRARFASLQSAVTQIQPQAALATGRIHAVTERAMLGENRLDVAIELHALVGPAKRPGEKKQRDRERSIPSRVHSSVPEAGHQLVVPLELQRWLVERILLRRLERLEHVGQDFVGQSAEFFEDQRLGLG